MVKKSFLVPLGLVMSLGNLGLVAPSVFANSAVEIKNVQTQALIEHVKIIQVNPDAKSSTVSETWYNPTNGYQRDDYQYLNDELIISRTKLHKYKPNDSMFDKKIKEYYRDEYTWKLLGYDNFDGKQVKKLKSIVEPKGGIYVIDYVDISTGLPIKSETYGKNGDKDELISISAYFFERINDQSDGIFRTEEKEIKVKKNKDIRQTSL